MFHYPVLRSCPKVILLQILVYLQLVEDTFTFILLQSSKVSAVAAVFKVIPRISPGSVA